MAKRSSNKDYVPALRFHALSALYDPMIRQWSGAAKMRASVVEALCLEPGHRVLELGSGPGRLAIEVKQECPEAVVVAVDLDERMLLRGRRNAQRAGVDICFRKQDITRSNGARYDRIYSTMTFHHLTTHEKKLAMVAARQALAPGGRFVVADFGRPQGLLQRALFSLIQQPLDGFANTTPHRTGGYERNLRDSFASVKRAAVWRTAAGTLEVFTCLP